jgi:hypothetical protein
VGVDDLTQIGRQQLFEHGVKFNLTYPTLSTDVLTVGGQDRVYVCYLPLASLS